jgi:hypothetical protein
MLFHSKRINKCIFLAIILSVGEINCLSQNNKYDPHSDTITIGDFNGKIKPPMHVNFRFDTTCIELYLDETRLAVLPEGLKQFIDTTRISRTKEEAETLPDGRNLLRIQLFIGTKRKARP